MTPYATVLENLCLHDPRRPDYEEHHFEDDDRCPVPRVSCRCDNCFYGRDRLAIDILAHRAEILDLRHKISIELLR